MGFEWLEEHCGNESIGVVNVGLSPVLIRRMAVDSRYRASSPDGSGSWTSNCASDIPGAILCTTIRISGFSSMTTVDKCVDHLKNWKSS